MGTYRSDNRIDLHQVFLRVQAQMLADLAASGVFEHPTACGAASEQRWINLFNRYLPERYRATSAFIIDADGRRSRQIDVAIYDRFYSPVFFHDASQPYIPAESVYAVLEVKQTLTPSYILDSGRKAASARRLRRTSAPLLSAGSVRAPKAPARMLAGILSLDASWDEPLVNHITPLLGRLTEEEHLDLGCILRQGAFESKSKNAIRCSVPEEALIYFMLRLISRLQEMGNAPAADFADYARNLK